MGVVLVLLCTCFPTSDYRFHIVLALVYLRNMSQSSTFTAQGKADSEYSIAFAIGPTGYMSQQNISPIPAICLFYSHRFAQIVSSSYKGGSYYSNVRLTDFNIPVITLSLAFLLVGYVTRVLRLFVPPSSFARKWLRIVPGNCFKRLYSRVARGAKTKKTTSFLGWSFIKATMVLIYVLLKATYEIHDSMLWEVS